MIGLDWRVDLDAAWARRRPRRRRAGQPRSRRRCSRRPPRSGARGAGGARAAPAGGPATSSTWATASSRDAGRPRARAGRHGARAERRDARGCRRRRELDAVLLIAFGGPDRARRHPPVPRATSRAAGRIPAERLEEVAHHYELIGGRSPLNELTLPPGARRSPRALAARRARRCRCTSACATGRRTSPRRSPRWRRAGTRRALGIILSALPDRGVVGALRAATWRRGAGARRAARRRSTSPPPWRDHPRFIEAVADRARAALAAVPAEPRRGRRSSSPRTASRSPWPRRSPYVAELTTPRAPVAERLGHARWSLAYQSRSGEPARSVARARRQRRAPRARRATARATWSWCRSASSATTSRCSTTSTSRRARTAAELGLRAPPRAAAVNDHPAFIAHAGRPRPRAAA